MKKGFKVFFLMLLISFGLIGCDNKIEMIEKSKFDKVLKNEKVTIEVKEDKITENTKEVTLVYKNNTDKQLMFGEEPHLEKYEDSNWYVVPLLKNVAWNDIGYLVQPNESREAVFNLNSYYSKLKKGHYRIIKALYLDNGEPVNISVEFDVE